jgi:hypothetical protein
VEDKTMRNLADRVTNSADVIDSRDVIERIDELDSEIETLRDEAGAAREVGELSDAMLGELEDLMSEMKALRDLQNEAESSPNWRHGETLIRDSYFEEYAEQLADDIGAIDAKAGWPCNCIDWEAAADLLRQDYSAVDFDGVTYWIRN